MGSTYNLDRFVKAQRPVYEQVCIELRRGHKTGHWMWFIFPQIKGLGKSGIAQKFAIVSLDEAVSYLAHPVLGERLRECTKLINDVQGSSIHQILGSPDDLKFCSCLTLFANATSDNAVFLEGLDKYFDGIQDALTLQKL